MPLLYVTTRDGTDHTVEADLHMSLMEAIRDLGGIDEVEGMCGGCCSCATCHVFVDPADLNRLPEMAIDESALLDYSAHRRPNSRLACQVQFDQSLDKIRVTVAPEE